MSTTYTIGEKVYYGRVVINVVGMDATTITGEFPDGSTKVIEKTDPALSKKEVGELTK